jgi:hypothetical protein
LPLRSRSVTFITDTDDSRFGIDIRMTMCVPMPYRRKGALRRD